MCRLTNLNFLFAMAVHLRGLTLSVTKQSVIQHRPTVQLLLKARQISTALFALV